MFGNSNLRKTKQDIEVERQAEFDDIKLGERVLKETRPGKIMAQGLKNWEKNKDKKSVKKKSVLAGMGVLERKFYLDCNRLQKNNVPNLYRRLLANRIDLTYIIMCLTMDKRIDAHTFT